MPKRFTDTDKWKKVWFRRISPEHKCFWEYLRDNCNNAGIWEVDFDLAEFQIGTKLNQSEIEQVFSRQFIKLTDTKWLLTDFVEWQYNCSIAELNPSNNAHLSAIRILDKYSSNTINEGLERARNAPMNKDKDMDKDKDKNKDKNKRTRKVFKKPTKQEVVDYCEEKSYNVNAEKFINHYEGNGWKIGKNKMVSWRHTLANWNISDSQTKNLGSKRTPIGDKSEYEHL